MVFAINLQKFVNLHYGASMAWSLKVDAEDEIRKNERLEIARGMKSDGFQSDIIEKYTGLTKEEIEKL